TLLRFLEEQRFAKSIFRELPKFFDQTHFEKKGEGPMAAFCTAMEVAKRNLEEVDPDAKISANELGYHTLKGSGLDKDERHLVIARADETFNFQKIGATLKNLFPRGGGRRWDRRGSRTSWRWANYNDGERDPDDEDQNVEHDGYWVQDGDDGWGSSDLFYIEDDADVYLASEGDEHQQALVTPRESRLQMNKIRAARGLFKGRIDGVVDESAAAGGKAAGKGGKGSKGKDGGKGKSKDKRCTNCGRMGRAAPDFPTQRPPRPAGKGFKGRGKTSKAQSRPRRLGFWATTALVCVMPDMFHQKGAQSPRLVTGKFQGPAEHDVMIVNVERPDLTGRGWLDKIAAELEKYGLKPIIVEASQEYFEIPGDMIGLASKKNLADWMANLYLREDGQWADFQELGVYDKELVKLPGGRAGIDIFDYDLESYETEPLFEKFRINVENVELEVFLVAETLQVSKPDFKVKDDADRWAQEAAKNGNKGIFKNGALKRIDKLMREYAAIFHVLRDNNETFLLELFAKEARFTHVASKGGHANATPSGLSVGVNFNDPQTRSDFLFLIRAFKPWMFSVAFPCAAHGSMQELQRAQGMGDRVGNLVQELRPLIDFSAEVLKLQAEGGRLGIGENPPTSWARREVPIVDLLSWRGNMPPLYETVALHQCMYGLVDNCGDPIRKPTCVMVPGGSRFPGWLERRCDGGHMRADMVGRSPALAQAGAWPDDPGKEMGIGGGAARSPSKQIVNAVAKAFKLRKDLIDVRALTGVLADYSDACAGGPGFATINVAKRFPTDAVIAVYAKEPKGRRPSLRRCMSTGASPRLLPHMIAKLTRHIETYNARLGCSVCEELGRPTAARSSNLNLSTEFNENVFFDEAEVMLADGARLMVMVILDGASGFQAGPSRAPQLKGRVGRAIDFFKDHFQRLNRDVQLAKNDDPRVWTSVIASTCNNHIRRNGSTPYQYVLGRSPGIPASLIEAMEGDQRQLASQSAALFEEGPSRAEQMRAAANQAFFELDGDDAVRRAMVAGVLLARGKHVKSKRLQGERGWRGPAIVLATEGHARLRLSYRGVPVLAAPGQVRHASRSDADMVENEDLVRQLSHWRGGPIFQKGFIDERGPGPDGSDETGVRRERDEKDSDHEDGVIDARRTCLHLETYLKYHHYQVEDQFLQKKLQTHLLRQLGRGTPWTWTWRLRQVFLINSNSNQIELSNQVPGDPMDQEALFVKVRNRQRGAFLSRRTDATKKQVTPKKGREIRSIPQEWKAAFDASDLGEWRKWVEYDAVDWPTEEELAGVDKTAARGNLSCEQRPLKAKSRNLVPGYKDKQLLAGELQADAPALTDAAVAMILQEAASQSGWRLEQGDVDSAFLSGKCLDSSRRVYFRVPKGGLPAVPEMGWPAVPEGAVLRAKKGIYGLNDAPPLWYEEHRDAMLSLPRASRSKLCPALFIFHDENDMLIGLIGTQMDDDLVTGSPEFFANQVTKLRNMHCCGKWQTAKTGFHRCGGFLKQSGDGTITCSQREDTESIEDIPISNERRKDKEAKATPEERAMLHSGNGQIQWLVRSTRSGPAGLQLGFNSNKLVSDAKTDHVDIIFQNINIDDAIVVAVGDSSHGNVGKTKTASQAGLVILLADNKDDQFLRGRPAKVTPMLWRSHRIERVVRNTLAAETMAGLEAVESGDMLSQHLVELHYGLGYRTHMDDVKAIKMVEVTDCKSLYDLLQKRGTVPSEKRLLIDIESLRSDLEFNNVVSKWVSTKQMLADCLTKHDVSAGDYMRYVPHTGECRLTEDLMADQIIAKQRATPFFEDCIADVRYNARVVQPAPKLYLRWRMMLGQREDDIYYEKLEDMVDWSGLDQVTKRRRIPTQVRNLLAIYAPTTAALERYEEDFTEKRTTKKPKVTNDDDPQKELGVTEEIKSGAAAAATVAVCALCRVALDLCECGPRARKKPRRATGHASHEKIADEFGDVIEDGVLEAYELVVKNCDECRRGKKTYASMQRGAKGQLKGKQIARDRIGDCEHNVTTTQGSNQYKDKLRCLHCGMLLVDTDATWWKQEKEYREIEKTLRTSKGKDITTEMKAIRLRDMCE
ncbi:unnamed protein product, partial [Prorocentrum cordatum]